MSFSAEASSPSIVQLARSDRRIHAVMSHPDPQLARVAWQCLLLGILAFVAWRALSGAAPGANDGGIWLVLAPLASLIALYRHRLGTAWRSPAPVGMARRRAMAAPSLQARFPRHAASRLRRAA